VDLDAQWGAPVKQLEDIVKALLYGGPGGQMQDLDPKLEETQARFRRVKSEFKAAEEDLERLSEVLVQSMQRQELRQDHRFKKEQLRRKQQEKLEQQEEQRKKEQLQQEELRKKELGLQRQREAMLRADEQRLKLRNESQRYQEISHRNLQARDQLERERESERQHQRPVAASASGDVFEDFDMLRERQKNLAGSVQRWDS